MNGKNAGATGKPAWASRQVTRSKGQAGYYKTGEGEYRDDVFINGQQVRMGPNTTITPNRKKSKLPAWYKPGGMAGVRG